MAGTELLTMQAANIFVGNRDSSASNHLAVQALKLPTVEYNFNDHTAGGAMLGIEIMSHVNRMESTFNLLGWSKQAMKQFGKWQRDEQWFHAYGVIVNRLTGDKSQAYARMRGFLGRVNPTEYQRQNLQAIEYSIRGITNYTLRLGDDVIYDINFFTSEFWVGGENLMNEENGLLGITGFTGSEAQAA